VSRGPGALRRVEYEGRSALGSAIRQVRAELFGQGCIYFGVKKQIGTVCRRQPAVGLRLFVHQNRAFCAALKIFFLPVGKIAIINLTSAGGLC
jgi:hypothetical protein